MAISIVLRLFMPGLVGLIMLLTTGSSAEPVGREVSEVAKSPEPGQQGSNTNSSRLASAVTSVDGKNLGSVPVGSPPAAREIGSVVLFNGENLDGWYVCVGGDGRREEQDIFTVEDGAIHVYGNQRANSNQPFACLITEESFSDYHLQLEYKWGVKKFESRMYNVRDSGVIFHVHGPDRVWPNGVEFQIQEGDSGDIWAIGTKVSSKVHAIDRRYSPDGRWVTRGLRDQQFARFHRSESWEKPGWNFVEILVEGNNAIFKLNGNVVNEVINAMRWDEPANVYLPVNEGKILLQAEGAEAYYRNIRVNSL